MKKNKIVYFFIGTTAEYIRISPVLKELKNRKITYKLIDSGQNTIHYEYLDNYIGKIRPDIKFSVKKNKSSSISFILWAGKLIFKSISVLKAELSKSSNTQKIFIVYGDPISSSIGAVIAKIFKIKLFHLESGDLSKNLLEPFPEEVCRNINIRLADVLFPPGEWAKSNLNFLNKIKINTYFNTLVEVYEWAIKHKKVDNYKKIGKYYLLIMHRQEHVYLQREWSRRVLKFVINNAKKGIKCVVFDHPLTMSLVDSLDIDKSNILKIPLVPYSQFLQLMKNSEFLASDSCTNQLEAYLMGKPYLALRNRTEQIEGMNENVVISKGNELTMKNFLNNYKKFDRKEFIPNKKPSKIIVDFIENYYEQK